MTTLVILISAALASTAVVTFKALPAWAYRLPWMKRKPFTCESCLAFWIGLAMLMSPHALRIPFYALAASATACIIWRMTQN